MHLDATGSKKHVPAVRARAVQVIQQCRKQWHQGVRTFVLPTINFAAEDFTYLLDWGAELIT